jgi:hypothetical protein
VLLDADKAASRAYEPRSLPMTWLIDRAGRLRFVHGEIDMRADRELLGELRTLLDE